MRRLIMIGVALLVIGAAGWGYWRYQQQQAAQERAAAEQAAQSDDLENVIWASGKLEPDLWAGVSPTITGIVSHIDVSEGDWVEAGQLLLELDNTILQSQVTMAEATLAEAEAALAKLKAKATDAEVAAAQAQVVEAAANVASAASQMLELQAQIDSANAQVVQAQRAYSELASHPTATERSGALAQVAVAQAAVRQAQAAYNLVRGDPQLAARPEAMTLAQTTAQLEAAQAQGAVITEGASPQQLAVAAAAIDTARTQVAQAESRAPGLEAGVKAAMAQQASAQAALDRLLAGATAEEVAIATAQVQAAQAALTNAQAQLAQSQLLAPFAGQVGTISIRPGESATPGTFVMLVGDTRHLLVKTTDLSETDVVRLAPAMEVEVTFDALPDRVFQGAITRIAPVSTSAQGSTNYTVQVEVAGLDASLRWGMTAFVNIRVSP